MADRTSTEQNQYGAPAPGPRITPLLLGGVVFAACMMTIIGLYQVIVGMAAIIDDSFYQDVPNYPYDYDVNYWGWVHMGFGIVVLAAAFSLFSGKTWARVVGIVVASLSALENFFFTPYYPVWSVIIIALDVLVIWSLTGYGHSQAHKAYGAPL
ncbi:DUF7144 family membrane protein [Streptomyces sp. HD]|uniref:DUF7144 family membrane protein n=1 Tax=Streptomyces sp. HD TaxID=3020892 RepID=UPI00232AD94D|nr:hypothetical protein [Streptomyces sp. HD]MDC0770560.1 hypothetical protein [Streptomyces sp. HD]